MAFACCELGLKPGEREVKESFIFGDGDVVQTTTAFVYPVGVVGHAGELDVALVERNCPGLMSRAALKQLGCCLDLENDIVAFRGVERPIQDSPSGHPMVNVLDYGNSFDGILSEYKLANGEPDDEFYDALETISSMPEDKPASGPEHYFIGDDDGIVDMAWRPFEKCGAVAMLRHGISNGAVEPIAHCSTGYC